MKIARLCFVIAVVAAFSATGLAVAQIGYPGNCCLSTPVPWCQNQCGCPISNAYWDFCSGVFPPSGGAGSEATMYYCGAGPGTCTAPNKSCGGVVVDCSVVGPNGSTIPCGCCGSTTNPPCPQGFCWNCPYGFNCIKTDKTGCGSLYGCTDDCAH